jgi:transcription termination factor NusB
MELTTLQDRIKERATQRLLKDLLQASEKLQQVDSLIGGELRNKLDVRIHYSYRNKEEINLYGDSANEIFDRLLPNYVRMVTDEILKKIDEIDYLLSEKNAQVEEY